MNISQLGQLKKAYSQIFGIDINKKLSPVVKFDSIQFIRTMNILAILSVAKHLKLQHFNLQRVF